LFIILLLFTFAWKKVIVMKKNVVVLLFAIGMVVLLSCNGDKYSLKFKPAVGITYKLKQETEQSIKQTVNGKVEQVTNNTTMILSFLVKSKIDDMTIIDVTIDRVIYSMNSAQLNMSFDSDKRPIPEDNMIARIFADLVGKSLTITFNYTGEILKVEGSSLIFETIINGLNLPNPAAREQLRQTMNQVIGEKAFKGNMGMITYIFPEKPVSIGSSWKNNTVLEQLVPTEINNEWKLESVNDGKAIIKGTSDILAENVMPIANMGQMSTVYNLRGTQDAVIEIDEFSGWILSAEMNNVVTGTIEIDAEGKPVTIPLEFTTHTTYLSAN